MTDTSWMADALCRQVGGDFWYSDKEEPEHLSRINIAKRVCEMCPVKDACLAHALATDERHGVWGGLTPRQRSQLVMRRFGGGFPHGTEAGRRRHLSEGTPPCTVCREADRRRRRERACGG